MAFPEEGTLTTDIREISISETWDTQTEWEAYQSINQCVIESGVVKLEDISTPTTVTSRPDDNNSASLSSSLGLAFTPNSDFGEIGFAISNNTSGATRARLYDYSQSSYVDSQDISGLSAGDPVTFTYSFTSGQDYGFELDAEGASWTAGFASDETAYPYTGTDIDIIARSDGGVQESTTVIAVNDIGNTGI